MYKITIQTLTGTEKNLYYPGNADYCVESASIKYDIGLAGEFTFTVPLTNPSYSEITQNSIVTIYEDNAEIWRGDIKDIKTRFDKAVEVYCLEDLSWLGEYPVPMSKVTTETYAQRFSAAISLYNTNQPAKRQFSVGSITGMTSSDLCTWAPEAYDSNMLTAIRTFIAKNNFLKVRRVTNNGTVTRYIDIADIANYGVQSSQTIEFGSNMIDYVKDIDTTNLVNVLYPYGAETEVTLYDDVMARIVGTPIQNDTSIGVYGRREKSVVFDTDNTTTLNNLAAAYLTRYSQPHITLDISAVDLSSISNVDTFRVGDSVRVLAPVYAVDQWFYITSMTLDLLDPAKNKITLSDEVRRASLTSQVNTQAAEIKDLPSPYSVLEAAKNSALQILQGTDGGLITFVLNQDDQIIEQIIANNLDIDQATKAWRWNLGGLAYLHRTYPSDPWTVGIAMTMDGGIVADFITTGTLDADNVNVIHLNANNLKAGIIQGQNGGSTYWNLNNNQFFLDATSYVVSSNPDYTGSVIPTNSNYPAVNWTTDDDKKANLGRTYYNTNLGRMYIYSKSGGSVKITFNANCNTESASYDWVDIYYEKDGLYYHLSSVLGGSFGGTQIIVPSPTFWLYWRTDTSVNNYYGWSIDSIVSTTDSPSSFTTVSSLPSDVASWTTITGVSSLPESEHNPYSNNLRVGYIFNTGLSGYGWEVATLDSYVSGTASNLLNDINVDLTQREIFNILTNNQQNQGLYLQGTNLYVNATMIGAGTILIGGGNAEYQTRPQIEVYDTDGTTVVGTWSRAGIEVNKGSVGCLDIVKTGSYSGAAELYINTSTVIFERKYTFETARTIRRTLHPYRDGFTYAFTPKLDYTMTFSSAWATAATTYIRQRTNGGSWSKVTQDAYIDIAATGTIIYYDTNSSIFQITPQENVDYQLVVEYTYTNYTNTVNFKWYADDVKSPVISKKDIAGAFRGRYTGSGDFTGVISESVEVPASDGSEAYMLNDGRSGGNSGRIGVYRSTSSRTYEASLVYDEFKILDEQSSSVYDEAILTKNSLKLHHVTSSVDDYTYLTYSDLTKRHNSGTPVSVTWSSSDERVKEYIKPLNPNLSRRLIDGTETKSFHYLREQGVHYGMIAQEARQLLDSLGEQQAELEHSMNIPKEMEIVEDQRTIDYQEYIPHLINYVKDLRAEIDTLKNEVRQLKEERANG